MTKVHFLGIGGSGASSIAAIAKAQGYQVSGCDKNPYTEFTRNFPTHQLFTGHSKTHLADIDILAVTPAVFSLDPHNEEIKEAYKRGIPVLTWQQFMGKYLERGKFVISICGTHGKSTTTAMIGQILEDAGLDPTVELGAIVPRWNANYRIGKSKYFITEADEFHDNFLSTTSDIAVVTTIEMDHPEYFKDFQDYQESFEQFLKQTKGTIVANISDPIVAEVLKYVVKETGISVLDYSKSNFELNLKIPGKFNILNAQAAFLVGLILDIDTAVIRRSLENYNGISRRFEYLGEYQKAKIYTDFAHHPTEIKVTLEAAREKFPNQTIIAVFQPHMFSRTKALFADFVKVFQNLTIDKVLIMDIYPSREKDTGIINSKQLVEAINKNSVIYTPTQESVISHINQNAKDNTIFFFVGAGDIDKIARELTNYAAIVKKDTQQRI